MHFSFVYMFRNILKLKAKKLFDNIDADLSWLLFLKKPACFTRYLTIIKLQIFYCLKLKKSSQKTIPDVVKMEEGLSIR